MKNIVKSYLNSCVPRFQMTTVTQVIPQYRSQTRSPDSLRLGPAVATRYWQDSDCQCISLAASSSESGSARPIPGATTDILIECSESADVGLCAFSDSRAAGRDSHEGLRGPTESPGP